MPKYVEIPIAIEAPSEKVRKVTRRNPQRLKGFRPCRGQANGKQKIVEVAAPELHSKILPFLLSAPSCPCNLVGQSEAVPNGVDQFEVRGCENGMMAISGKTAIGSQEADAASEFRGPVCANSRPQA